MSESRNKHIAQCKQVFLDYNLCIQQELESVQNVLEGAKRSYLSNVRRNVNTYNYVLELIGQG